MESLRPNTIEEVFELADALMRHDYHEVMKELGDVMEHVVFYALIGDEAGEFDMADVCNREADKLMFRHPFIDWNNSQGDWTIDNEPFSVSATDMTINAKGQVVYKDSEAGGSQDADKPKTARIQDKARNVGFDWQKKEDVWDKVKEEMGELEAELKKEDKDNSTKELGDFLFSVINAARLYHLNPDNALEHTNRKFISRFGISSRKPKSKARVSRT